MSESPDITRAQSGLDGVSWNILGQIYVPKQITDESFAWHATFPEETFVPPHMHHDQDEYIFVLDGRIDLILDGRQTAASAGDLVRMPRGIPHGYFNKSDKPARALFWVSPARHLEALFKELDTLTDVADIVRISSLHEVDFLPPDANA